MGTHHKPPRRAPEHVRSMTCVRQPGGSINIEIVRGRCQKITHSRSGLGSSKFSAGANCPQAELSSRVASRQRSGDFTPDILTALCLKRTMLGLQVTQRVTREHLHGMIMPGL